MIRELVRNWGKLSTNF